MKTSKRLWLIEGPDGAGKTTLARAFADATDAHYAHLGPFPRVERGLARLYVDAMMPAVLGLSDVVLDRCWLSERPYGTAFRDGTDRLGPAVRALERLAWRCQTLVVRCLPPWETVATNFGRCAELLNTTEELRVVYDIYKYHLQTSLPMVTINPFDGPVQYWVDAIPHHPGVSVPHALGVPSAGNLRAKVTLVGEGFGAIADRDPLYQWPFGSLCRSGCSAWLGGQLERNQVSERDLFWVNADALTPAIDRHQYPIVALGTEAAKRLAELGRAPAHVVDHPQYHKRFHHNEPYPLIDVLKGLLDG